MKQANILVVEDERVVAEDINRSLLNIGYQVTSVVSSGEEALDQVKSKQPDLVLMDIVLRGALNGIETAEQIRSLFNIPVVYLTAYADEDTLSKAKLTEPFGYILKPFNDRELHSTIEMAIYKHNMEKKLRESEVWFSTTLRSIGDGVVATDEKGHITFLNSTGERLTGWCQKEAVGKHLREVLHIINSKTGKSVKIPVTRILKQGGVLELPENSVLVTLEGKKIAIDDSVAPIIGDRGDIIGVVLIMKDITERKKTEETLRMTQDKLVQSEKLAGLGALASNVVHEIGNPMAAITNSVQVLQTRLVLEGRMKELMDIIGWETERLNRCIDELREFSRPRHLKFSMGDMREVVKKAIFVMNQDFELVWGRRIEKYLPRTLVPVWLDFDAMEQVALNLIKNGLQAVAEGGIVNVRLQTRGKNSNKSVRLTVKDNGPGIKKENIDRIFEPYFSTKARGIGLGMHIVKQIVESHEGTIHVSSTEGQGTTIRVDIPVERIDDGQHSLGG